MRETEILFESTAGDLKIFKNPVRALKLPSKMVVCWPSEVDSRPCNELTDQWIVLSLPREFLILGPQLLFCELPMQPALPFELLDTLGNVHRLSDSRGRWLILVFHRHLG